MIVVTSTAGDLLTALRSATTEAHRRLEDTVDIPRVVLDPEGYRRLLAAFFGFYRPLERELAALTGWESCGLDLAGRWKTPWLASDLAALGLEAPALQTLPDCAALPALDGLARGLGCLYVLEGATLGGRQITALMQGSPAPPEARRFFASYGAETGLRWREFLAGLRSFEERSTAPERADLLAAALDTFHGLQRWLEEAANHP